MAQKKKLQVFLSSTYTDLKAERQAAIEVILTAGHIPAGMELFAAGDESQMNAIKRWIDESDVFLLILGGRYGSIEPKSQKSYIQLEYEYAIEKGKPVFAVVNDDDYLKERVKKDGIEVYETENPQKLKEFHALVQSRLVRFWSESRDITGKDGNYFKRLGRLKANRVGNDTIEQLAEIKGIHLGASPEPLITPQAAGYWTRRE